MTYLEAQTKALARVDTDISDTETTTLNVVKEAINNAYMLLASMVDKRTKTTVLALDDYDNKLPLPSDFSELVMAEHENLGEINPVDYEQSANIVHFKSKDMTSGDVTLTYVYLPTLLSADTDVINLKDMYNGAVTAYAAYTYQLSRKKYSAAQLLLQEFNSYLPSNNTQATQ